ncbi:unnamed protein product [Paramecium sonneborni]|uniref:Uncharacterized protein n=1 Tax=Paramecium sonneborni TaxID=65129 RepID=A0A8S1QNP3_9CILI|nr:unnamed protein product [Paramecium sonneborni]
MFLNIFKLRRLIRELMNSELLGIGIQIKKNNRVKIYETKI